MAGRCGCQSSGVTGVAIANSSCIGASGMGNIDSPFVIEPIVDPDPDNLLECGAAGLRVDDPDKPGQWTAYDVQWRSAGSTQPVLNDGQKYGYYRRRGGSVEVAVMITFGYQTTLGQMGNPWQVTLPSHLPPLIYAQFAAEVGGFACIAQAINVAPLVDKFIIPFNDWWGGFPDTGRPDWAGPNERDDGTGNMFEQPWPPGTRICFSGVYPTGA